MGLDRANLWSGPACAAAEVWDETLVQANKDLRSDRFLQGDTMLSL